MKSKYGLERVQSGCYLDLELAAAAQNDYDFPDEMVTPLMTNAFTDDNVLTVGRLKEFYG